MKIRTFLQRLLEKPVTIYKKDKILFISLCLVLAYVLAFLYFSFTKFDYDYNFGYLDHQLYWESMHRLLDGQIFYRDFYWEYGPLYLIYSLPLFVLFQKSFTGYVFIRTVFLPLTGFLLAYIMGKQLLKGRYLLLFLALSSLYSIINFESIRHGVAELGLVLSVVGLFKNDLKKYSIGCFIVGLSFTSGIEYALLALLVLYALIAWKVIQNKEKTKLKNYVTGTLFIFLIPSLFFTSLIFIGAMENYINFFKEYSSSFLYLSPCRTGFPIISQELFSTLINFRNINLFAVPLIGIFLIAYLFKLKDKKIAPVLLALISFSGLAYFRTMVNPCLNTLSYSVTLLFLVITYLIGTKIKISTKILLFSIFLWFVLVSAPNSPKELISNIGRATPSETIYIKQAGVRFPKEKADRLNTAVDYLKQVTRENDYVYVYPYGPINQLTNTRSPVSTIISTHFELAPFLVPKIVSELEEKKPEYIVVNRVNSWSYLGALYLIPQAMADYQGAPVFLADLTDVERYISQNYIIDQKFDQIWILKRRPSPVEYIPPYVKKEVRILSTTLKGFEKDPGVSDSQRLLVSYKNPEILYTLESLANVNLIKIPVKGNLGLFRLTSQYLVQVFIIAPDGTLLDNRSDIMATQWQKVWMEVKKDERLAKGAYILVRISDNRGFFSLGGTPSYIETSEPEFYQFNPLLFEEE